MTHQLSAFFLSFSLAIIHTFLGRDSFFFWRALTGSFVNALAVEPRILHDQ